MGIMHGSDEAQLAGREAVHDFDFAATAGPGPCMISISLGLWAHEPCMISISRLAWLARSREGLFAVGAARAGAVKDFPRPQPSWPPAERQFPLGQAAGRDRIGEVFFAVNDFSRLRPEKSFTARARPGWLAEEPCMTFISRRPK